MRVFVLTTGRTASQTFAHACQWLEGMTSGHETNTGLFAERLNYPDNHVEVDNRLVWFLGGLEKRYGDADTFYVYLTRDAERVADSYLNRWHLSVSVVRAFYHGILMIPRKPDRATARESICFFIQAVDENVRAFLSRRDNWVEVRVEDFENDFFMFMQRAGLSGERDKIATALNQVKNFNKKKYRNQNRRLRRFFDRFSSRRLT